MVELIKYTAKLTFHRIGNMAGFLRYSHISLNFLQHLSMGDPNIFLLISPRLIKDFKFSGAVVQRS